MKIPNAKAAGDKKWKKLETIPAWDVRKVKSKKEVIKEAQKTTRSSLRFIDGLMSSKEFGAGATIPEVKKGSVVLRGDIVKDDSTACAVFTEQGSSASQMTAAKVRDVIA